MSIRFYRPCRLWSAGPKKVFSRASRLSVCKFRSEKRERNQRKCEADPGDPRPAAERIGETGDRGADSAANEKQGDEKSVQPASRLDAQRVNGGLANDLIGLYCAADQNSCGDASRH